MDFHGRALSIDMTGPDVRSLHRVLARLGLKIADDEVQSQAFGATTREAVLEIQRWAGVAATGTVDDKTAAVIEDLLARLAPVADTKANPGEPQSTQSDGEGAWIVRGRVTKTDGTALSGLVVIAFNRDLRTEEELGKMTSGADGRYEIRYQPRQVDPNDVAIEIRVLAADGSLLFTSATVFNPPREAVIDCTVGGAYRGPSEYRRVFDEVSSHLDNVPLPELQEDAQHQDISFLAAQLNLDGKLIAYLVAASRMEAQTGIPSEIFYGMFREGMPTDLDALLAQSPAAQTQALEAAIAANIIGVPAESIDQITARLRVLAIERAVDPHSGGAAIGPLLGAALPDPQLQTGFLDAYASHRGTISDFWTSLSHDPTYAQRVPDIKFALQLGALTGNHLPLVNALEEMRQSGRVSTLQDLAHMDAAEWESILTNTNNQGGAIGVPPDAPGTTQQERVQTYARSIAAALEAAFPTATVVSRMERGDLPQMSGALAFLQQNPSFDLRTSFLDDYLAANPGSAQVPPAELDQVRTIQRLYRVTTSYDRMRPLAQAGLDSAAAIARMGGENFVTTYGQALGGDGHAWRVYHNARQVSATALNLLANYGAQFNGLALNVLPDYATPVGPGAMLAVPSWQELFGSLDLCDCRDCRSVLSPAAYLVDVLHFMRDRQAVPAATTVKDVLFERRPDLGEIELTCENTNTPVPYVDLVNEVLENAINPPPAFAAFDLAGALVADLNSGHVSPALRAAFAPPLSASASLVVENPGLEWRIDEPGYTYRVRLQSGVPRVLTRSQQTTSTPDELGANPQYVNAAAYDTLAAQIFPWALPFDAWATETRAYLGFLGVNRADLMKAFQQGGGVPTPSDIAIASERLAITTFDREIITAGPLNPPRSAPEFWGFPAAQATWVTDLRPVPEMLKRSTLEYPDLLAALGTAFCNPTGTLQIVSTDPSDPNTCDINKETISDNVTAADFDRIHRFVRLWRRLGWSMHNLDRAILAFRGTIPIGQRLDDVLMGDLSAVQLLAAQLSMPMETVLCLWSNVDTAGPQYAGLFQNPTVLQPPDPAFKLAAGGAELDVVTTDPANAHIPLHVPAVVAGAGITADDLNAIQASGLLPNDILSLANLSEIVRVAVLAKGLGLSVPDLLRLRDLSGINPFDPANTSDTVAFALTARRMRSSGFSIAELDYLLRHAFSDAATVAPTDLDVALVLDEIRRGLQKIAADNQSVPDPTGDVVRRKLAKLPDMTGALVDRAMTLLDGSWGNAAAENAFIDAHFAAFLDPADAKAKLVGPPPGLLAAEDRYAYTLSGLLAYLSKTQGQGFVIQKLGEALKLGSKVMASLLQQRLQSRVQAGASMITDYLDPAFAASDPQANPLDDPSKVVAAATIFARQFQAHRLLAKVALVVGRFKVTATQLAWIFDYGPGAGWLDLNSLPLAPTASGAALFAGWLRLLDLFDLRNALPLGEGALDAIFSKARQGGVTPNALLDTISGRTTWNRDDLGFLAGAQGLNLTLPDAFKDEAALVRLSRCFDIIGRLGATAAQCRAWAKPDLTSDDGAAAKRTVKAKYDVGQWPSVARPLRDPLREQQRAALVAYLVAHPNAGAGQTWKDADGLYEYYLIDVQMEPCMNTSRIKQAIGSCQQFVQRCLMNLEPQVIANAQQDSRWLEWKWMKHYRVWEANRKIFLWPENWIEPELRDDKSPFFKEFENELLQSDLRNETAEDAFMHYLEKLDEVARLEIMAFYHQVETDNAGNTALDVLHVVGRTRNTPHIYYYRKRVDSAYWTAWEKVGTDIQGDNLAAVVWNRRLYLLWLIFTEKTIKQDVKVPAAGGTLDPVQRYMEVQLAWSEYKRGKWSAKKISKEVLTTPWVTNGGVTDPNLYMIRTSVTAQGDLVVHVVQDSYGTGIIGRFFVSGCDGSLRIVELKDGPDIVYILAPRRTYTQATKFVEAEGHTGNDDSLYLTTLDSSIDESVDYYALSNGETDIQVLATTPGTYDLVVPFQHMQYASQEVSFFEDAKRTFFIEPRDGWFDPHLWYVEPDPILVGRLVERYYGQVQIQPPVPDPIGPVERGQEALFAGITTPVLSIPVLTGMGNGNVVGKPGAGPGAQLAGAVMEGRATGFDRIIEQTAGSRIRWIYGSSKQYRFSPHYHPFVCLFMRELNRDGIDGMLQRPAQIAPLTLVSSPPPPAFDFQATYSPLPVVDTPYPVEDVDFSYGGSYGLYNWELTFHAPLLIATRLTQNQRFEDAQRWFHFIFDPTDTSGYSSPQRFWRTRPFFETAASDYRKQQIDNLLNLINSGSSDPELAAQVKAWTENPFKPHLVARLRTTAYQKTTVMKYLDNLIAWGDQLFRQDTIETINEATQLYVLAAEILGPRPRTTAPRVRPQVQTFNTLAPNLDAFSNAAVKVEEIVPMPPLNGNVPFQNQPQVTLPAMLYFCVPQNDLLLGYWDTVANRLFKIRHCLNIEGVAQQLALFEPPINPMLLVKAAAAGVDLSSALNDVSAPVPHYRFSVIAQKAAELCAEVKALGAALQVALEKRDAEMLASLRSTQEISVLQAERLVRQQQIDDAQASLDGLMKSRELTTLRRDFYQNVAFLNPGEQGQLQMAATSLLMQAAAADLDLIANVLALIPNFKLGAPTSIGATFGGENVSQALKGFGSFLASTASLQSAMGAISATMGGHSRRWDDWKLQEKLANKELEQLDKQIAGAQVRLAMAQQELSNQDLRISNAQDMDETMRERFTNQDLYDWMLTQLSSIYFQAYGLAYDVAKQAERAYRYELGLDDSSFIQFGYWDSLKKGLLAGERLSADLRRMEVAYLDANKREYELTKHVSLAMLNPLALAALKVMGLCTVDLPEGIFDLDNPGHYMRRLKSVAVTIPCVVGPYTGVNCTLTLSKNSVRRNSSVAGGYPRIANDPRFIDSLGAVQSIVTSSAQSDSGMFETNLRDERYLPFEGCGAISTWTIQLDPDTNAFDFETITDVVLHIRYTARDGGQQLHDLAKAALPKTGARMFSLRRDFPNEWFGLQTIAEAVTGDHVQTFGLTLDRFPFRARGGTLRIRKLHVFAVPDGANPAPFAIYVTPPGKNPNPAADQIALAVDPTFDNMLDGTTTYPPGQAGPGSWTVRILAADYAAVGGLMEDLWLVAEYEVI